MPSRAADDLHAKPGEGALQEIVVTAQKRQENIQDVPISLRALSEEELRRAGVNGLADYAGFAPGLNLISQGPERQQISMRGVATGDLRFDRPEVRETVGLYLDETPISAQIASPDLGLLDIERIEVLRGPQGTLYGAGSLSGTVRMITRKPDLQAIQVQSQLGVSDTAHGTVNYEADAVINAPLITDALAMRAVVFHRYGGGFIDSVSTGRQNINDSRESGGRFSIRAQPASQLTVDASVVLQETHLGGDFSYRAELAPLEEITRLSEPTRTRVLIPSAVISYDLGPLSITNAASWFNKNTVFSLDAGGFADLLLGVPNSLDGPTVTWYREREFSEELRVASRPGGRLIYTAGIFFQHQSNGFAQSIFFPGFDAAAAINSESFGAQPDQVYVSDIALRTRQYALFGEITWAVTPRLDLSLGGRAFKVKQDSTVSLAGLLSVPLIGSQPFRFDASGFNPKINMAYHLSDDALAYAQAAKGFRLGGTNEPIPGDLCAPNLAALGLKDPPASFKSDTLWNYEVGVKTSWLDRRLVANVAAYYIDWKDPPLAADLACGFSTELSAGRFKIPGAEIDLEARPTSAVLLRAGVAVNEGHLSTDTPLLGGRRGDRVPETPKRTFDASADYDLPLRLGFGARAYLHADYRYTGSRVTTFPDNPNYSGYFSLPHYSLVDFSIGLKGEHVDWSAYVDNAFDTLANLEQTNFYRAFDKMPGTSITTIRPRTAGMRLRWVY